MPDTSITRVHMLLNISKIENRYFMLFSLSWVGRYILLRRAQPGKLCFPGCTGIRPIRKDKHDCSCASASHSCLSFLALLIATLIIAPHRYLYKEKKAQLLGLFRRRYFYYGDSKIYIMYWGVFTVIIISCLSQ